MGAFMFNTAGLLALFAQVVLPIVVGFVTKRSWSPGMKSILLLVLTSVTQLVTTWLDAITHTVVFHWQQVVWNIVIGFIISVAVHYGFWKPTGASDTATDSGVKDNPVTAVNK